MTLSCCAGDVFFGSFFSLELSQDLEQVCALGATADVPSHPALVYQSLASDQRVDAGVLCASLQCRGSTTEKLGKAPRFWCLNWSFHSFVLDVPAFGFQLYFEFRYNFLLKQESNAKLGLKSVGFDHLQVTPNVVNLGDLSGGFESLESLENPQAPRSVFPFFFVVFLRFLQAFSKNRYLFSLFLHTLFYPTFFLRFLTWHLCFDASCHIKPWSLTRLRWTFLPLRRATANELCWPSRPPRCCSLGQNSPRWRVSWFGRSGHFF